MKQTFSTFLELLENFLELFGPLD